jgi:6-phosphofructokinase 2
MNRHRSIVTLTLNPTIDGASETDTIRPLHKIRTSNERYSPGGGGINVARAVRALGGEAAAIYLAGGPTGEVLEALVREAELDGQRIPIAYPSRIAHAVFERSSGLEYRFVPEGPEISAAEWAACRTAVTERRWDYLVASGSLPPAAPVEAYAELAAIARHREARLVLDSSGAALRAALEERVFLVKPSLGELESLVGHRLESDELRFAAAEELVASGRAAVVALSLGHEGAMLVTRAEKLRLRPPPVEARSAVGAGDAFVGAMTLALARGRPVADAFAYGVAAGTAAVAAPGHEPVRLGDVERLYQALSRPDADALAGSAPG